MIFTGGFMIHDIYDVGDDGYIVLANAIIIQAIDDYKNADDPEKHIDKREVRAFF